MSVDYRGLRLVEQVLEAESRRDGNCSHNDNYNEYARHEVTRLFDLLCDWVADSTAIAGTKAAQDKANELLKTFRI